MVKSLLKKTDSTSAEEGGAGFGDDLVADPGHLFVECGAGQRRAGGCTIRSWRGRGRYGDLPP